MSELLKKAMELDSEMLINHFEESSQALVAVVNNPHLTENEVAEAGFESGTPVYPEWVVEELRQEVTRLTGLTEPHPPSRTCECERCREDFAEKDKSPADGLIYQAQPVAAWNETNAQMALIMALNGNPEQKEQAALFFHYHLNIKVREKMK